MHSLLKEEKRQVHSGGGENPEKVQKTVEQIESEFQQIFKNQLFLNEFDTTGIQKVKSEENIVYTAYDISKDTDAYEINIKIPVVNIKNELASSFNSVTQAIFVNKASEILKKTDTTTKTIYSIDYVAYVNNNILSLVIRSTLKEGASAQRVMIQTYNYNLLTQQSVTLNDIITSKTLNKDDVNAKIKQVVSAAYEEEKAIQDMGYNTEFSRDLNSSIYTVDQSGTYFLGENNQLYIIYAYGNQNFTSEMDIVLFD